MDFECYTSFDKSKKEPKKKINGKEREGERECKEIMRRDRISNLDLERKKKKKTLDRGSIDRFYVD